MKKDLSLEGLRGIAALAVFFAHFIAAFLPYSVRGLFRGGSQIPQRFWWEPILSNPAVNLLMNGALAVQIFFVLSGYVLTKRYFEKDDQMSLRIGLTKRYTRLVIPVFVSCVFAWVILTMGWMGTGLAPVLSAAGWPMASYAAPISFTEVVTGSFFRIPFFGLGTAINSPLWTMYVEMAGSFILFGVYLVFGKEKPLWIIGSFTLIMLMWKPSDSTMIYFFAILSGSLIHYFKDWLVSRPIFAVLSGVIGVLIGAFSYSRFYAPLHKIDLPHLGWPLFNLEASEITLYTAIGAFFIVCSVIGSARIAWIFALRIPVYLGRISFSLYLLHWPIICSLSYAVIHLLFVGWGWRYEPALAVTLVITLLACLGASHLMTRYVDEFAIGISDRFARWCWRDRIARSA